LKDEKKIFTFGTDTYAPNNYGDTFSNKDITLRDALVKSKNTITVDVGMQVNIGKVMNLAAKAGMPKVEKAYPSMALGTAEATPLQVATAYTMFANLGDRVLPLPITQLTTGDGYTRVMPQPDKKNVIRPDVAYIMDDIMKDVINRGTAAAAQGWGFRNVDGKTGFAGKTGTSRDGWFAGFTPDLVCVVYVGFDENDDLGMKGSDSAMPIWADFMKAALDEHPEWNGDWPMPIGIRKAEIDTRNGALIRELDAVETAATAATPLPTPKLPDPAVDDPAWAVEPTPEIREVFATNVPEEFRRVELFISGTIPNRQLLTEADLAAQAAYEAEQGTPSPTPIDETWQEELGTNSNQSNRTRRRGDMRDDTILVTVCPITGMRAASNCPLPESRSYQTGNAPAEFCRFHK
jgi:penicillin-binding protein 1B